MVIAEQAQAVLPWRAGPPGRPLLGLTALVVEDSRFASEAVRLLCLRSGARIRRADSLRAAARHMACYRPAVVIVDLGLPDGNGADLIAAMARATPRVPVLLGMSGDPDSRAAALEAGADAFLAKPVESLAHFQHMILSNLPADARPLGPRLVIDDRIIPDGSALRDDFVHAAEVLAAADSPGCIDYVAGFLAGLARASHDARLGEAAAALAREHAEGRPLAAELARVSGMVRQRLADAGV
ncbi:response regulator [Paracoccus sp. S-4012]|uniref:response regulator n=1 Tax=Paracoccus sp. S-4012 TaxID=2665648 RepID=UPI0012B0B651|nr:response regulator [Paracoccus sp. S-4012]MRX49355.1 response regulator [Paracoccus sp. S-4012]